MTDVFDQCILVTGGAGFIGSCFLENWVMKFPNIQFTCIDKLNYVSDHSTKYISNLLKLPNFNFVQKDLAIEFKYLHSLLVEDYEINRITGIINFAAESSVDRSFTSPLDFTQNNIISSHNLFECARLLLEKYPEVRNKFKFLHVSTDEVYGEQALREHVAECSNLKPTNPYAATKAAIDMIAQSYIYSFHLPITIIRSNNVYGPNQYKEKLIPMVLDKLQRYENQLEAKEPITEKITIHGNGTNKRTYIHVQDLIAAIEILWMKMDDDLESGSRKVLTQTYNIGTTDEIDNLSLVEYICDIYFAQRLPSLDVDYNSLITFVKDRNYNDSRYALNFDKMTELGWKPSIKLTDGIKQLVTDLKS
ncbi:Piso0_002828 [Millerozyma farinosa CBS 7064]|uniref:Piso0_002828 protein n=1 Tax=Pichia sorbitophila (strain ATCC MYA-4447 / BCRC 22081 / CBS 7064 / NBRC 10061 / NRRL Y-12695) TaxID=559304 RepID=G8YG31_PICSO|nr:Piso0_002828 [Millerozyma farinosa CBS 7064]